MCIYFSGAGVRKDTNKWGKTKEFKLQLEKAKILSDNLKRKKPILNPKTKITYNICIS